MSVVSPDGSIVCQLAYDSEGASARTAAELKQHIERVAGVAASQQRLLLGDRELAESDTIPEGDDVVVTLVRVLPYLVTVCDDIPMGKQQQHVQQTVRLLDAKSGQAVKELKEPPAQRVNWAALRADGALLAVAHHKGVRVLDMATESPFRWPEWNRKGPPQADIKLKSASCVSFSRDGELLLVSSFDNKVRIISMTSGAVLHEVPHHETLSRVFCACFNASASLAATGMEDGVCRIISVSTGEVLREIPHSSHVLSVCFHPGGGLLATGCGDKAARVFDITAEKTQLQSTIPHLEAVASVCFSPDGSRLATGAHGGMARILDVSSGEILYELACEGNVYSVCFSADGELLAMACQDGIARVAHASTGELLCQIRHGPDGPGRRPAVRCVAFPGL